MKMPFSDSLQKRIRRLMWEAIAELLAEASEIAREIGKGKSLEDIFEIPEDETPYDGTLLEEQDHGQTGRQPL